MSNVALFIVETYQGSFIPVSAFLVRIDEVEDCMLTPLSYSMPYVLLEQAQEFLRENAHPMNLVYDKPIKMNPSGLKWLSEIERAQEVVE